MTVNNTNNIATFLGDGVTTLFTFSFVAVDTQFLTLVYTNAGGAQSTIPSDQYTVTINAPVSGQLWGVGGTIRYPLSGSPIASGTSLTLTRTLSLTQTMALSNQASYGQYASAVERALDLIVMQQQQVHPVAGPPGPPGPQGPSGSGTGDMLKSVYDPNVDGVIAIAQGGTNATTAANARANLGLATVAATGAYSDLSDAPVLAPVATTGNYNDLTSKPTLGTAASQNYGTAANQLVRLDGSALLPAVDGSQLINLPIAAPPTQGAVGSYALCYYSANVALAFGAVVAGSTLSPADVAGNASSALTGTWRCMGNLGGTPYTTLFLRIA